MGGLGRAAVRERQGARSEAPTWPPPKEPGATHGLGTTDVGAGGPSRSRRHLAITWFYARWDFSSVTASETACLATSTIASMPKNPWIMPGYCFTLAATPASFSFLA